MCNKIENENGKTVQDLINEHKCFLVPSYQRGYRWRKINVLDLLNDLKEFIDSDQKIYSLQPLVVFDAGDSYHVVDGQQRLTTLSILRNILKLKPISLKYKTRDKSQQNQYSEQFDNIDQYHVNRAYETIQSWFESPENKEADMEKKFRQLLKDKLGNKRLKFIWYCTKDDEIATFIRLNKNRISLTNAELIKAMLLKKGNFDGDAELKQKSIAVEWNLIENTFNDDAFWRFLRPKEDDRDTRIDFLFEVIKEQNFLKYEPKEETGNDKYSTFRYFYSYFKDNTETAFQKIWDNINELYKMFTHWYDEIEMYHYIGFLLYFEPGKINGLIKEWKGEGMTINGFKMYLKGEINKKIKGSGCNYLSKQYKYDNESGTDKTSCTPILLLFNIQRTIIINRKMNEESATQIFTKFPFYLLKNENWNVEHIASNTDNDYSKPETQKNLLKTYLLDVRTDDDLKCRIKAFIKRENPDEKEFSKLQEELNDKQNKDLEEYQRLDDKQKNQIWNFCLLDEHTNKSYGNSIFPVKRRIIMGKEMGKEYYLNDDLEEGVKENIAAFVPICTKDAFIKAYTANDTSNREWSIVDAMAYRQEMYDCLKNEFEVYLTNDDKK